MIPVLSVMVVNMCMPLSLLIGSHCITSITIMHSITLTIMLTYSCGTGDKHHVWKSILVIMELFIAASFCLSRTISKCKTTRQNGWCHGIYRLMWWHYTQCSIVSCSSDSTLRVWEQNRQGMIVCLHLQRWVHTMYDTLLSHWHSTHANSHRCLIADYLATEYVVGAGPLTSIVPLSPRLWASMHCSGITQFGIYFQVCMQFISWRSVHMEHRSPILFSYYCSVTES